MSPDAAPRRGLLVAIVGPSGAGKDTVARLALDGLAATGEPVRLARRVVTRAADRSAEDHDSLDARDFARAEEAGAFCLTWRANGLAYGLPSGVAADIATGGLVLANLSRRSLGEAAERLGRLAVVEIVAEPALLRQRLTARGREAPAEITARLSRAAPLQAPPDTLAHVRIDNSGKPEDAAATLERFLRECLRLVARDDRDRDRDRGARREPPLGPPGQTRSRTPNRGEM